MTKITTKKRVGFDISPDLDELLEKLAVKMHGSKADVLKLGIGLVNIAANAKDEGKKLTVSNSEGKVEKEIVNPLF